MDLATRRRALQAAAKVAFSYALIGAGACGGSTTSILGGDGPVGSEPDPSASADDDALATSEDPLRIRDAGHAKLDARAHTDSARDVTVDDAGLCSITNDDAGLTSSETRSCCTDQLSATSTVDAGWGDSAFNANAAGVHDCCAAIVNGYWSSPRSEKDMTVFNECCTTFQRVDGFMACTPWGPPMPPAWREVA